MGLLLLPYFYSAFCSENGKELACILLVYCVLVATYGALTSSWKILIKQGFFTLLGTFISSNSIKVILLEGHYLIIGA